MVMMSEGFIVMVTRMYTLTGLRDGRLELYSGFSSESMTACDPYFAHLHRIVRTGMNAAHFRGGLDSLQLVDQVLGELPQRGLPDGTTAV